MSGGRPDLAAWMRRVAVGDLWAVSTALEAIPNPEMEQDAVLLAFRDMISELVRSREAFDEYNRGLERVVLVELEAERDRALLAEARATAASRAKSRFLASVSHELRTPLNVILGYTEMLCEDITDPDPHQDLRRVEKAAHHLLSLIDDVLDISSIETGQMRVQIEEVQVAALASEVVECLGGLAQSRGLELRLMLRPGLGSICTDERKLRQALLNVVTHACSTTEEGTVTVSCQRTGESVSVTVADTGPGMDAEECEHAFEEFVQAHRGGQTDGSSGLGLPVSRRLCRLLGGDLVADSEPGTGTVYTFRLPTRAPSPAAATRPAGPARRVASGG